MNPAAVIRLICREAIMRRAVVATVCGLIVGFAGSAAQDGDADAKIAGVVKDLESKDSAVRYDAITELAEYGSRAKAAVPALVRILQEPNEELRVATALTLGKIGKAAVAPVTELLSHPDTDIRFYGLWALGNIGPEARAATAKVLRGLGDKDANIRRKAAYALGRIGPDPKDVVRPLIKAFTDDDADVRQEAGDAVGRLGAAAVPQLIEAVK